MRGAAFTILSEAAVGDYLFPLEVARLGALAVELVTAAVVLTLCGKRRKR